MKKLLMIVALVGTVLTGYSKTNGSSNDAQAQKPSITLYTTGSAASQTITLHATQPVPETVQCDGQYQAPGGTGYWNATLSPGATSVTVPANITSDNMADIMHLYAGGKSFYVDISAGPCETDAAIYYFNH